MILISHNIFLINIKQNKTKNKANSSKTKMLTAFDLSKAKQKHLFTAFWFIKNKEHICLHATDFSKNKTNKNFCSQLSDLSTTKQSHYEDDSKPHSCTIITWISSWYNQMPLFKEGLQQGNDRCFLPNPISINRFATGILVKPHQRSLIQYSMQKSQ